MAKEGEQAAIGDGKRRLAWARAKLASWALWWKEEAGAGVKAGASGSLRGSWASDWHALFAALCYVVGFGNVWKWPALVAEHGTGFMLAHVLTTLLVGFPLVLLESTLGQFMARGPVHIFRHLVPVLEGVGWLFIYCITGVTLAYQAVHALALFYLIGSFNLYWGHCYKPAVFLSHTWNTQHCFTGTAYEACVNGDAHHRLFAKGGCYDNRHAYRHLAAELQRCVLAGDAYADPLLYHGCAFRLRLAFSNAHTPRSFFNLPEKAALDPCHLFGLKGCSLALAWQQLCSRGPLGNSTQPHPDDHVPFDVRLDLDHRSSPKQAAADELAAALRASVAPPELVKEHTCWLEQPEPKSGWPMLACLLHQHCRGVLPAGFTPIACLRAVVDTAESYSAGEFYEHFMGRRTLDVSPGLLICLAFVWAFACATVYRGPRSAGRMAIYTGFIPFILVLAFPLLSFRLAGFSDGLAYYLKPPSLCDLGKTKLWADALSYSFFSLGLQAGGHSTIASYKRFHSDVAALSLLITLGDLAFSFMAGIGVFGILGHFAHALDADMEVVVRATSNGVAFVGLAQAFVLPSLGSAGQLIALCFYAFLVLLATQSVTFMLLIVTTFVSDEWKRLRCYRRLTAVLFCTAGFLATVPFISSAGFTVAAWSTEVFESFVLPTAALTSIVIANFVYGTTAFLRDGRHMLTSGRGWRAGLGRFFFAGPGRLYLYATLWGTAPVAVAALLLASLYRFFVFAMETSPHVAAGKVVLGPVAVLLLLAAGALKAYLKRGLRGAALWKPTERWGPPPTALPSPPSLPTLPTQSATSATPRSSDAP